MHKQIAPAFDIDNRNVKMHGAARLFLHRLCHEGGMYIVIERCLPDCTLEQKSLVGQFQRLAMIEIISICAAPASWLSVSMSIFCTSQ